MTLKRMNIDAHKKIYFYEIIFNKRFIYIGSRFSFNFFSVLIFFIKLSLTDPNTFSLCINNFHNKRRYYKYSLKFYI